MPRFLPPLGPLRHFEAAARLSSFKEAAKDLNLTPGAIGQQVADLEQFFGFQLFERSARRVTLTDAGRRLAATVERALNDISATTTDIYRPSKTSTIRVEAGPFFSARWLAPRLIKFIRLHPDINIKLLHNPFGRKLDETQVDISFRWGDGHWPRFRAERFLDVDLAPVISPAMQAAVPQSEEIASVSNLFMHTRDRKDWAYWLASAGLPVASAADGIILDEANVAVEAVVAGGGIGIGYFPLMREELRSGRLICPFSLRVRAESAYYLLTPPIVRRFKALNYFRAWLRSEVNSQLA